MKTLIAHAWAFIVFLLMIMRPPSEMSEIMIVGIDKIAHIAVFAIMSFLYCYALVPQKGKESIKWIVFIVSLYSISLECLQTSSFTNRDFDIFDIIANIIGTLVGATIFLFFKKKEI